MEVRCGTAPLRWNQWLQRPVHRQRCEHGLALQQCALSERRRQPGAGTGAGAGEQPGAQPLLVCEIGRLLQHPGQSRDGVLGHQPRSADKPVCKGQGCRGLLYGYRHPGAGQRVPRLSAALRDHDRRPEHVGRLPVRQVLQLGRNDVHDKIKDNLESHYENLRNKQAGDKPEKLIRRSIESFDAIQQNHHTFGEENSQKLLEELATKTLHGLQKKSPVKILGLVRKLLEEIDVSEIADDDLDDARSCAKNIQRVLNEFRKEID